MRRKPFDYPDPPECHTPAISRTTINGVTRCSGCGKHLTLDDLKTVSAKPVSKQGIPSQWNNVAPHRPNNSWERGVRTDERGVPRLDKAGMPVHMGSEFNKRDYESNTIRIS